MVNIRDRARAYLDAVPETGQINSNDGTGRFEKLTGVTQAALEENWAKPPPFNSMTACNEFVGKFGATLGSKNYLGTFFLDTQLGKWGKGLAWVPFVADGPRPKYGDIFLRKKAGTKILHQGISLDFNGATWNTPEAGQGGKNTGYDIIKRKQTIYPGDALLGWVDLELYFKSAAQTGPAPEWLVGWWKVTWRGQAYYYYFDRNRQVKWTQILPGDTSQPPLAASDTGTSAVEPNNAVTTRWGATGSVEKFSIVFGTGAQMEGTWNGTEPLTAASM
jgi:hypothetical protein